MASAGTEKVKLPAVSVVVFWDPPLSCRIRANVLVPNHTIAFGPRQKVIDSVSVPIHYLGRRSPAHINGLAVSCMEELRCTVQRCRRRADILVPCDTTARVAGNDIGQAVAVIRAAADAARTELDATSRALSHEVATQVLGRPLPQLEA